MLVLTRKHNETIELPGLGVTITIVKIKGNQGRVGINAPREEKIVRGELLVTVGADEEALRRN